MKGGSELTKIIIDIEDNNPTIFTLYQGIYNKITTEPLPNILSIEQLPQVK